MPAQKTDWKQEAAKEGGMPLPANAQMILGQGTRRSQGNEGRFPAIKTREDLLRTIEANRQMYQALRKRKGKKKDTRPHRDQLKGLFGGG